MSVRCFRVFPEALDPCFACFALSRSSPCNAYHSDKTHDASIKAHSHFGHINTSNTEASPDRGSNEAAPSNCCTIASEGNITTSTGGDTSSSDVRDQGDVDGGFESSLGREDQDAAMEESSNGESGQEQDIKSHVDSRLGPADEGLNDPMHDTHSGMHVLSACSHIPF